MIARVQQYHDLKGYGWLLKGFRTRIYFHVRAWKSDIAPQVGMVVSYDLAPSKKPGLPDQAVNVIPLTDEEAKLSLAASEILAAKAGE